MFYLKNILSQNNADLVAMVRIIEERSNVIIVVQFAMTTQYKTNIPETDVTSQLEITNKRISFSK